MADEGNEDSWLYGKADGGGGQEEDERDPEGGKKNGSSAVDQSAEDSPGKKKRPRCSFSDDEHHQHDDNAMDSSDLVPAEDDADAAGRGEEAADFQGEEDSHLQEDEGGVRSDGEMDSDDSDDDDDINVVIRPTGPSYNIIKPRGAIIPPVAAPAAPGQDKAKQPAGKFSIDEFESVGTINGVPAHEFSIDSLEEKPWRKPGSDITDYFNYGFNEETWRAYCERQKRMRMHESGVGLQGLTINNPQAAQTPNNWRGPPPPRKMNNGIDVIGGMNMHQRPEGDMMMPRHPKENVIQVMTADRREYSRSAAKFDSMGAPFGGPPDFYQHEADYGDYGYEPTQESQWNQESQWQPHGIKTLTPGPPAMMQGMGMPPPHMMPPPMSMGPPGMGGHHGMRSHERRSHDRSDRDRSRRSRGDEREHRRDRDRGDRDRESAVVKMEGPEPSRPRSEKPEDKEKRSSSKSDRHKDRYRERSRSREKSKSRRRSRSRERERHSGGGGSSSSSSRSEKKKSRKDKEESE
ncbi:pre-mRNA 3'-end-processing factor FIP1 [Culex quinquefasciatus]|uniref:pre-mRNA 3'-end-processing factor FIP1 n=1 Tax=Culex quinquefasciatus TaxID=7176 RepID=UPI0018E3241D|nr:pre-mRNA 3'-end-processing factor FIP1 [Culex quinquefasciatus]